MENFMQYFWVVLAVILFVPSCLSRRLMGGLIKQWFEWWPGTQAGRLLWFALLAAFGMSVNAAFDMPTPWWFVLSVALSYPIGSAVVANRGALLKNLSDYASIYAHGNAMILLAFVMSEVYRYYWSFSGIKILTYNLLFILIGVSTVASYKLALMKPLNIPSLGLLNYNLPVIGPLKYGPTQGTYTVDVPPTGELYIGIFETVGMFLIVLIDVLMT
jgi:hypothetical protein